MSYFISKLCNYSWFTCNHFHGCFFKYLIRNLWDLRDVSLSPATELTQYVSFCLFFLFVVFFRKYNQVCLQNWSNVWKRHYLKQNRQKDSLLFLQKIFSLEIYSDLTKDHVIFKKMQIRPNKVVSSIKYRFWFMFIEIQSNWKTIT